MTKISFYFLQIENLLGGDEKFHSRVNSSLVPCIAQFSVAMADDSLWKPLNFQILLKMRHSSSKVGKCVSLKEVFVFSLMEVEKMASGRKTF